MRRRTLRRSFLLAGLVLVTGVTAYALHSAHLVTSRMEGRKWELASRMYAAPPIYFPGAPWVAKDLEDYLKRLGYVRVDRRPVEPGEWLREADRWEIGLRAFRSATAEEPARGILIGFEDGRVTSLHEVSRDRSRELYTVSLEPERIGTISPAQKEERTLVRLEDVPRTLRETILLMEDQSFYSHHGISFRGIARALWNNLLGGQVRQGGSTLTQQLMKNFFLTPERTLRRKIREAIMTVVAEVLYSKDEILEAYLNEIYLGQRGATAVHGFGESAKFYFSKEVQYLTAGEQALLVGLIQSPGKYSPYLHPEAAAARRNLVLEKMRGRELISAKTYERSLKEPVKPRGLTSDTRRAPYFVDFIREDVAARFSQARLETEGYEIHSTLDANLQQLAEKAVGDGLAALQKKLKGDLPLQAALVALHPGTGGVKALVGGRDWQESQFNRATHGVRPVGSLIKPFLAAAALTPGDDDLPAATPATILADEPATFMFSGKEWAPSNYGNEYFGPVTLRQAVERSLNLAMVNLTTQVGLDRVVRSLRDFGFVRAQANPSVALGAIEMTPLEMARMFTAFAGQGLRTDAQGVAAVIDAEGRRVEQRSMEVKRVLSPPVAYQVMSLLAGAVDRGTARSARASGLRGAIAGKTGTTDDYRDSWFVGFTPSLVTAVWVGLDDNAPTGLSGASGALPIWIRFMREVLPRSREESFREPEGLVWADIDPLLGCRKSRGETLREAFLPGTEPAKCR